MEKEAFVGNAETTTNFCDRLTSISDDISNYLHKLYEYVRNQITEIYEDSMIFYTMSGLIFAFAIAFTVSYCYKYNTHQKLWNELRSYIASIIEESRSKAKVFIPERYCGNAFASNAITSMFFVYLFVLYSVASAVFYFFNIVCYFYLLVLYFVMLTLVYIGANVSYVVVFTTSCISYIYNLVLCVIGLILTYPMDVLSRFSCLYSRSTDLITKLKHLVSSRIDGKVYNLRQPFKHLSLAK